MVQEFRDGNVKLVKVGPLGPFANNAYVVVDSMTGDSIIVDAPQESEKVFPALEGLSVRAIVVTHRHGDHWAGIDAIKAHTGAPVMCHSEDAVNRDVQRALVGEEELEVGSMRIKVIHTPGHTPGSICLLVGDRLISGDTLFPGGPGRTMRPEDLRQEIESIASKLYVLPDDIVVHPGHGGDTTIGESRREYAIFASRSHPEDLAGDVTWLNS
jgi:glyoxylase-like metal-dependent hydrolase (beta-lactamase superfamily II)